MECRDQRGALPACRHVAATEIGNDVDAGQFGEQRRIADLDGEAPLRLVAHGLPVAADGANGAGVEVLGAQQLVDALGREANPVLLRAGGAGQFIRTGGAEGQQVGA
ncbi:hypothetical protein D3C78_1413700 [compost metagenome]